MTRRPTLLALLLALLMLGEPLLAACHGLGACAEEPSWSASGPSLDPAPCGHSLCGKPLCCALPIPALAPLLPGPFAAVRAEASPPLHYASFFPDPLDRPPWAASA